VATEGEVCIHAQLDMVTKLSFVKMQSGAGEGAVLCLDYYRKISEQSVGLSQL
jgi:hypothetical protein